MWLFALTLIYILNFRRPRRAACVVGPDWYRQVFSDLSSRFSPGFRFPPCSTQPVAIPLALAESAHRVLDHEPSCVALWSLE